MKARALVIFKSLQNYAILQIDRYLQSITMDKIRTVINQFNLQVNIIEEDGQEKLLYDENDKWAILKFLLDDAYLSSQLTGIDYEANSKRELQHT